MRLPLLALLLSLAACASEPDAPDAPPPAIRDSSARGDATVTDDTTRASDAGADGDSILVGDPPTRVPGPLRAPPAEWTSRVVDVAREGDGVATLLAVREGAHDDFVRVTFEFADRVPGYHLEYVDRPVQACGSGEPVAVTGDGWLEVRLRPAQAHTDAGEATVADRDRHPPLPLLRQLTLTCDFEADVTWVLGLTSPNRYRVAELASPPRLVVDVRR